MAQKQIPAVTLDPNSPSYGTPSEAADAISANFAANGGAEQAAVVIKRPDGSYGYSTLAPQDTHDSFALRAQLPKDHSLAGIIHSHPSSDAVDQVFSPQDVQVANQLNVPSYIRFSDNSIRQYVPGQTKTKSTALPRIPGQMITPRVTSADGDPLPVPAQRAQQQPSNTGAAPPQVVARNDDTTSY